MVDIHHHLLAGLDDGARDLDTSVAMARLAVADGITHVACSPHANGQYSYDRERVEAVAAELRERLARDGVGLTIGVGCDLHLSYDNIQDALAQPSRYTVNSLGYLLVELPDYGLPPGLTETFYEMQLRGMAPVLTHPERNLTLQRDAARLGDWLRGGLLVQVTADSVTGQMGRNAEKMAHFLLAQRYVHFVASDAHNTGSRAPRMSQACQLVAKKYGADYARALCEENPMAAFEGRALPPQAEPKHLYDDMEEKSWLDRLLRR